MIVTYGIVGGSNASEQLKTILTGMKLRVVETRVQLGFYGAQQGPDMQKAFGGVLGEESKKMWEGGKQAEIVKGVEELSVFLRGDAQPVEGA